MAASKADVIAASKADVMAASKADVIAASKADVMAASRLQLWELGSGELLLSILFDVSIMSVTLDPCEYFLFCGGSDGNIFQVSLCSQVHSLA